MNQSSSPRNRGDLTSKMVAVMIAALSTFVTHACLSQTLPVPLGWWPGDGDGRDYAHANDGSLMNGTTFDQGRIRQSFALDGVDDYIQTSTTLLNSPTLTYAAWIKTTSSDGVIVSAGDAADRFGYATDLAIVQRDPSEPWQTNGALSFYVNDHSSDTFPRVFTLSPYNDGQWHHVVGVFTNSGGTASQDLAIYVDGVKVPQRSLTQNPYSSSTRVSFRSLRIGRWDRLPEADARFFNGNIDDVRIYDRALSSNEVLALYASAFQVSIEVSEVRICWPSMPNKIYQVQFRSDLATNDWFDLGTPVPGTGLTSCLTDPVLPGRQRFYRVIELNP